MVREATVGDAGGSGSAPGWSRSVREWGPLAGIVVGFLGVIATVLAVGVATLQAVDGTRTELIGMNKGLRTELLGMHQDLRTELLGMHQDLRAELFGMHQDLRTELLGMHQDLRTEFRSEMHAMEGRIREDIRELRTEIRANRDRLSALEERFSAHERNVDAHSGAPGALDSTSMPARRPGWTPHESAHRPA
ncbi:MAG: hypothetical protein OXU81_11335 [Gammaproteobacteria bacterium]|nr:hypothetical protein [Gammaproteobacteria bacterium]